MIQLVTGSNSICESSTITTRPWSCSFKQNLSVNLPYAHFEHSYWLKFWSNQSECLKFFFFFLPKNVPPADTALVLENYHGIILR